MTFEGTLASRQQADAIFADLERMRLKYDVKKVFADGNDVCVFYDVTLSGVRVFTGGWCPGGRRKDPHAQGRIRSTPDTCRDSNEA